MNGDYLHKECDVINLYNGSVVYFLWYV